MTPETHPNVERFSGFADCYDTHRPKPPPLLTKLLSQLAGVARPKLVVDLGSGTGLATRVWDGKADRIIGIEPNADMRRQAERASECRLASRPCLAKREDATSTEYRDGTSTATGLPDGCADIVTASQALHWMEPEGTFAEVARILRPGGVFAAIDCDWPPVVCWEVEEAWRRFSRQSRELEERLGISEKIERWGKDAHLERMRASGRFRQVREVLMHNVEQGDAARLVGLARSQGGVATALKMGLSEDEVGLTALREAAELSMGSEQVPWYWSYRMRVGTK